MTSTPPAPPPPPPGPVPTGVPVSAPSASGRNRAAGVLALVGLALVLVGTALPIVEFDVGGTDGLVELTGAGVADSASGWGDGLNDGPIHLIVAMLPLVAAFAILRGGARRWAKVVLILAAVIGFFWVSIRFADISGSLDEGAIAELTAQISDPGVGLYAISAGWALVLVAGFVAKAVRSSASAPSAF